MGFPSYGNPDRDALIADLEAEARLADLKIERTSLKDLTRLQMADMTAGELITLANVYEAITVLTDIVKGRDANGRPMGDVERRDYKVPYRETARGAWDDVTVQTVNGPMKYVDIPKDDDGEVPEEWVDENCPCEEHERTRNGVGNKADDSIARGLYL